MTVLLPQPILDEIESHAVQTFPEECCGIIVERGSSVEVVRVTNVQNERHAEDPQRFPRTAATAYAMGPEAAPVLLAQDRGEVAIRAFYHSHPQHEAYFSAEDRKQAVLWDEPSYPEAAQVVVSVFDRRCKDMKAFRWSEEQRDFVEAEIKAA